MQELGSKLALIEVLRHIQQDDYLELVHRIDKGTSGCSADSQEFAGLKAVAKRI